MCEVGFDPFVWGPPSWDAALFAAHAHDSGDASVDGRALLRNWILTLCCPTCFQFAGSVLLQYDPAPFVAERRLTEYVYILKSAVTAKLAADEWVRAAPAEASEFALPALRPSFLRVRRRLEAYAPAASAEAFAALVTMLALYNGPERAGRVLAFLRNVPRPELRAALARIDAHPRAAALPDPAKLGLLDRLLAGEPLRRRRPALERFRGPVEHNCCAALAPPAPAPAPEAEAEAEAEAGGGGRA